jgi:hypothetical protein
LRGCPGGTVPNSTTRIPSTEEWDAGADLAAGVHNSLRSHQGRSRFSGAPLVPNAQCTCTIACGVESNVDADAATVAVPNERLATTMTIPSLTQRFSLPMTILLGTVPPLTV